MSIQKNLMRHIGSRIIQTKKALSSSRAGQFKTKIFGSGYDFDQLRDYQQGDDVRFIDWKSSARTGGDKLLLREYKDERSRTAQVIVDCSDSMLYGTQDLRKQDVVVEIAAALLLMCGKTDDNLGLHFMSNKLEKTIHPASGSQHMQSLLHELVYYKPNAVATELKSSFEQFGRRSAKSSLVFIISDFIDPDSTKNYETALKVLSRKHEVACVRIADTDELDVLSLCKGIVLQDSEGRVECSASSHQNVIQYKKTIELMRLKQEQMFKRLRIPLCDCTTSGDHMGQLLHFINRYF